MQRRVIYPLAGLVLATALAAPQVVATASTEGSTIRLTEKVVKFTQVDVGKRGISQGDSLVYSGKLLDQSGNKAGRSVCQCAVITPKGETPGLLNCATTYQLKGGQIAMQGFFDMNTPNNSMAIVGGTGRYAGTTGEVKFLTKSDDTFAGTLRLHD